jgi:hypothetical protein
LLLRDREQTRVRAVVYRASRGDVLIVRIGREVDEGRALDRTGDKHVLDRSRQQNGQTVSTIPELPNKIGESP